MTQSELGARLEDLYDRRRSAAGINAELAPWERDRTFMALALALWPTDVEASTEPYQQTSRQRLRLRWEGFRAIADAEVQLLALLDTAQYIRERYPSESADGDGKEAP